MRSRRNRHPQLHILPAAIKVVKSFLFDVPTFLPKRCSEAGEAAVVPSLFTFYLPIVFHPATTLREKKAWQPLIKSSSLPSFFPFFLLHEQRFLTITKSRNVTSNSLHSSCTKPSKHPRPHFRNSISLASSTLLALSTTLQSIR